MTKDNKIINAALWFFALCVAVILLTSCSPYAALMATATPSQAPTVATVQRLANVPTPTPAGIHCTVTAANLYIRAGASMAHEAIKVLHSGDVLRVIERGAWLKVETAQHVTGWVYSKFCN